MCSSRSIGTAPLAALSEAVEALAAAALDDVDEAVLGGSIVELHVLVARLDAELGRRTAAFDGRGAAAADGCPSTAAWLRSRCLLGPGEARGRVLVARALDRNLPATRAALSTGAITYRHASVITQAVADLPADVVPELEAALVTAAERTDPTRLRRVVARCRGALDPDLLARDADDAFDARQLYTSTTYDGTVAVNGTLDSDSGAVVLTALHAYSAPTPDDRRTPAQRRADALVAICRRALDSAEPAQTGGERPHLTVVVDLPALLGRPGALPAELGWTGPASLPALLRHTCDASVVRIVTAGPSEVLDVGRRSRVVPPALRRALDHRDAGCVFPGCDRPPPWCDAHHLRHWAHGGATNMDNLALLCSWHHHAIHDRGWNLTRAPDGRWHAERPGSDTRAGPCAA